MARKPSMMTSTPLTDLESSEALVRRFCGWHVAPVISETLTLDGSGGSRLLLPTMRLVDVHEVTISGTVIDLDDLEWSQSGIIRWRGRFPDRLGSVTVQITHGFEPEDVNWVVQQIADRVKDVPKNVQRVTAGQQSVTYNDNSGYIGLLKEERDALAPYRIVKGV